MKFFRIPASLLLISTLVFSFLSCADSYETVDEKGVSFVNLSISLSEEVAVPGGTVLVTYGASRNGTDTVSAALNDLGTSATARLDEYFANGNGKFTKLSFVVKNATGTEIPVKASVSSIKADKDGASVSLSAKNSTKSEEETAKTDETDSESQNDEDDDESPYLPASYKNKTLCATYTYFDSNATRKGAISDRLVEVTQGSLYAFFFFDDSEFLLTEKNFEYEPTTKEVVITLYPLVRGTYTGQSKSDGELTMNIGAWEMSGDSDTEEDKVADWDEEHISEEHRTCTAIVSDGAFSLEYWNTFLYEIGVGSEDNITFVRTAK